jgi:hypothetical protein
MMAVALVVLSACGDASTTEEAGQTAAVTAAVYPPRSLRDLSALAARRADVRVVESSDIGAGGCRGKRVVVILPAGTDDETVVSALARAWTDERLDRTCGSAVFAYNDEAQLNGAFTAGALSMRERERVEVVVGNSLSDRRTVAEFPL